MLTGGLGPRVGSRHDLPHVDVDPMAGEVARGSCSGRRGRAKCDAALLLREHTWDGVVRVPCAACHDEDIAAGRERGGGGGRGVFFFFKEFSNNVTSM